MEDSAVIKEASQKMTKAVEHTVQEFNTIHTGKASPSMVENVSVMAYGSNVKLKEVAAITTPEARTIVIQPWDKGVLRDVEKAIKVANIGLNPIVDGAIIRCPIPELSRERRQEMVKTTNGFAEEGRVRIRMERRKALDQLKKDQKARLLSKDELERFAEIVQTETDRHIEQIATHFAQKEKELMQV